MSYIIPGIAARGTAKIFLAAAQNRNCESLVRGIHHGVSMRYARLLGYGAILVSLAAAGCGGGGSSSSSGGTNPPPSNVTVTISPTSSTVGYGSTHQFTAKVSGATNTAVTWSVSSSSSSSSSQIGSISSSGLYTAPTATSVSVEPGASTVSVTANNASSPAVANVTVQPLNTVTSVTIKATSQANTSQSASATVTLTGLSIIAVGQCTQSTTDPTKLNCSAASTGTAVSRSSTQTLYLFVAGFGILPGTTYAVSGSDVTIPVQPTSAGGNFNTASSGIPVVYFQIVVSPSAVLGPRDLVVRNSGNELTSFVGGVDIVQ